MNKLYTHTHFRYIKHFTSEEKKMENKNKEENETF